VVTACKPVKICLAASAGGHLTQLLKLAGGWTEFETFFVTTTELVSGKLSCFGSVYVVGECNRRHPVHLLKLLLKCASIILKEKPDVVISTGAAVGCVTCYLAKLIGAQVVWIDSITNVEHLSMSGRLVRYISNLFLVQWAELTKKYRKVEFMGAVI
jgi:UDP-N-acetylglucosamine:LPS N-acetylglucosamine transferase